MNTVKEAAKEPDVLGSISARLNSALNALQNSKDKLDKARQELTDSTIEYENCVTVSNNVKTEINELLNSLIPSQDSRNR